MTLVACQTLLDGLLHGHSLLFRPSLGYESVINRNFSLEKNLADR